MSRVIVAIGGTGQMVLHYYCQLFLIGLVREPFHAYVFDTDAFAPSLRFLSEFFEQAAAAAGPVARKDLPVIGLYTLKPENQEGQIVDILAGGALPTQPGYHHPIQAFFSKSDHKENVMEGLYGRPALSAVLAIDESLASLKKIPSGSTVVTVASCIGGTGGGLTVPILWQLENQPGANHLLRAAFLGDYFTSSSSHDNLQDQDNRFRSNRLFFLKTVQEALNLQHYSFIEEPKMTRDKAAEQATRRMAWPVQDSPYWRGASDVQALLSETVQESGGRLKSPPISQEQARALLAQSLGRVHAFLQHSVLDRLRHEAFAERVWGENLVRCLRTYASFDQDGRSTLAHEVQVEMSRVWAPVAAGDYGLSQVFPEIHVRAAGVNEIVRCDWPSPHHLDRSSVGTGQGLRRRLARLLLLTLLREGGSA